MSYMKTEFEAILAKYGHNVYLQRRIADDANGAVYRNKYEIYTVRYTVNQNLSTIQTEEVEGIVNTSERLYYFPKIAVPFEGDRIYEYNPTKTVTDNCDENVLSGPTQTVWIIDATTAMRGLGGDIEYYTAGATRILPN